MIAEFAEILSSSKYSAASAFLLHDQTHEEHHLYLTRIRSRGRSAVRSRAQSERDPVPTRGRVYGRRLSIQRHSP